jgi:ArsR family transcriptional regulator
MPASTQATDVRRAVGWFHALSDPTRLEIVEQLAGGERCVCELTADLDAAQSRLSFHLRTLKNAGLVSDRREGRWVYYTLVPEALEQIESVVSSLRERSREMGRPRCC